MIGRILGGLISLCLVVYCSIGIYHSGTALVAIASGGTPRGVVKIPPGWWEKAAQRDVSVTGNSKDKLYTGQLDGGEISVVVRRGDADNMQKLTSAIRTSEFDGKYSDAVGHRTASYTATDSVMRTHIGNLIVGGVLFLLAGVILLGCIMGNPPEKQQESSSSASMPERENEEELRACTLGGGEPPFASAIRAVEGPAGLVCEWPLPRFTGKRIGGIVFMTVWLTFWTIPFYAVSRALVHAYSGTVLLGFVLLLIGEAGGLLELIAILLPARPEKIELRRDALVHNAGCSPVQPGTSIFRRLLRRDEPRVFPKGELSRPRLERVDGKLWLFIDHLGRERDWIGPHLGETEKLWLYKTLRAWKKE